MHVALYLTDQGIFGVPLSALLEGDVKRKSNTKIPLVFQEVSMSTPFSTVHCLTLGQG